jgi:hypothetical protein
MGNPIMTLQTAVQTKEAITTNTGLLARVCIVNGEFEATPILPGEKNQLSRQQRSALYVVYTKGSAEMDFAIGINTAMQSGVFDSRTQCVHILNDLRAFGWLREHEGRFSLSEKGADFVLKFLVGAAA